jgi:hypothetical protein
MPDDWLIRRTKSHATHFGRAIPAFIHHGDYHLTSIDAYADGAVNCWDFLDLPSFKSKVASGWVVGMTSLQGIQARLLNEPPAV